MKIGIIECGTNRPEWAAYGSFGSWFPPLLAQAGVPLDYAFFHAPDGKLPDAPSLCDAWLLTGSPASTYDDAPWQRRLSTFLDSVIGRQPVIGICYGHQHLHQMLGGTVEKVPDWGVGIHHYALKQRPDWLPDTLAQESSDGFHLIALHQDQVTTLAEGSTVLAASDFCPAAVTTIGDDVLTFQPHPEMAPAFAAEVYEFERQRIGNADADRAIAELDGPRNVALAARWMVAFLQSRLNRRQHHG
jgi:GMP synthase-like glutamine amidotransferase